MTALQVQTNPVSFQSPSNINNHDNTVNKPKQLLVSRKQLTGFYCSERDQGGQEGMCKMYLQFT